MAARAAPPRVALVVRNPADPLVARMEAEIAAIGFDVVIARDDGSQASPTSLERAARQLLAIAAVRVVPAPGGVEVWIADRVTGKTVVREVTSDPGAPPDNAVVALRAVELLRGSLLEIRLAHNRSGEVTAPPAVESLVAAELKPTPDPALALGLAPALLVTPGGVSPAMQGVVSLVWMAGGRWGLEGQVAFPLIPGRISAVEGKARVDALVGTVGGRWIVYRSESGLWRLSAGAAAGILLLTMEGSAAGAPYTGRPDRVVAATGHAGLAVSYNLTAWLRLGAEGVVGAAAPWPRVLFAGRAAADWGLPSFRLGLGMSVLLP